jgi:hypothetical protein
MEERWGVVRRLFLAATEILEDNHIVAVGGQSQRASMSDYHGAAQQLQVAAAQLATWPTRLSCCWPGSPPAARRLTRSDWTSP